MPRFLGAQAVQRAAPSASGSKKGERGLGEALRLRAARKQCGERRQVHRSVPERSHCVWRAFPREVPQLRLPAFAVRSPFGLGSCWCGVVWPPRRLITLRAARGPSGELWPSPRHNWWLPLGDRAANLPKFIARSASDPTACVAPFGARSTHCGCLVRRWFVGRCGLG